MNRRNEFEAMIQELNRTTPELETTLDRAYQKKRKRTVKMIVHPLSGFAACFVIFVLLVNFCTPITYACSQIPVLRELAAAVTFSRSLTNAVENAYVQPMNLKQTANNITAEIAHLIVDQKQVHVFYRLDSHKYSSLNADPEVLSSSGDDPAPCSCYSIGYGAENGELRHLSIDFVEDANVPNSLRIKLNVYTHQVSQEQAPAYLAEFEFLLEFDPKFTATGKIFPVNQTVMLDGQAITITDIKVYPTHMRVEIAESPDNTAWLKDLEFYIETDWGMKFDPVSSGITAIGSSDSPSMVSYRADSPYFYNANRLKLVITGAKWLRKDMETTWLNLVTGEHGALPDGTALEKAERRGDSWTVRFRAELKEDSPMYQLFGQKFFDSDGNDYTINRWSNLYGAKDEDGNISFFYTEFSLKNYPYEEVWLSPQYSHTWTAEKSIVITVQ